MVVWSEENAAHLLSRAGFGGSSRDIKSFGRLDAERATARLVGARPSKAKGPGKSQDDAEELEKLRTWWLKRMVAARGNRLQEKMCLFWHDHFATGIDVVKNNLWMAQQNQRFRLHGMGSFHELVRQVTKDPAMLEYLDGRRSTKLKPNENYGREVMELFVLGVQDLAFQDNYTQTDVSELTRALTGWVITADAGTFDPARWDPGVKTLFAGTGHEVTGVLGMEDSSGALLPPATCFIDALFQHRDSTGELTMPRFLAHKLWEFFAYPDPSLTLVDEVAAPFLATATSGYLIAELLRAIFTHDEFYSDAAKNSSVRNPCEYAISSIRALGARTNSSALHGHISAMGMDLFEPPGVNGWTSGAGWLSSGQLLARFQFAQALAAGRDTALSLKPTRLYSASTSTPEGVVDAIAARLGIATRIPPAARQAMIDYFGPAPDLTNETVIETKVRGVVALMLDLPECQIH